MTLKDLPVGQKGEICGFSEGCRRYRARLLAMGLTRGTVVELIRMAPMGDPIEIELRGFRLTLRKEEANVVLVEPDSSHESLRKAHRGLGRRRNRKQQGHHKCSCQSGECFHE